MVCVEMEKRVAQNSLTIRPQTDGNQTASRNGEVRPLLDQ